MKMNKYTPPTVEVWASCLRPDYDYAEGRQKLGDVFRVGWKDGSPIPTIPYPNVQMRRYEAKGVAYRVQITGLEDALHAVHSRSEEVNDKFSSGEEPPKNRARVRRPRRGD